MSGDAASPRAAPPDLSLVAAEMFGLARNLREQARGDHTARVTPEAIARIAVNVGVLARAVARADRAYAEGARQRDEASAHAAAITDVPAFLKPAAEALREGPAGPCCASCRHFRPRDPDDHRRIPGAGLPDGICGLRDPGRMEGMTRYCNRGDWCDRHAPQTVTKGPGA